MRTRIQVIVVTVGLLAGVAAMPVVAQMDHSKMGQKSGMKMSHEEMVAKLDKMSTDDKAALVDKMSVTDKKAAMKTSGHDVNKMSAAEKADMFDKLPMDKKMTMMMQKDGKTGHTGMGKMDK